MLLRKALDCATSGGGVTISDLLSASVSSGGHTDSLSQSSRGKLLSIFGGGVVGCAAADLFTLTRIAVGV